MSLECGKKPECPEETHWVTERTCKLHTDRKSDRIQSQDLLLRGHSANHRATVHTWFGHWPFSWYAAAPLGVTHLEILKPRDALHCRSVSGLVRADRPAVHRSGTADIGRQLRTGTSPFSLVVQQSTRITDCWTTRERDINRTHGHVPVISCLILGERLKRMVC